jgi:putative protease
MIGNVKGGRAKPYVVPREALLNEDLLRIGYEDDAWHTTFRVGRYVPKKGQLFLKFPGQRAPAPDTPVFLIDRREPEVERMMQVMEDQAGRSAAIPVRESAFRVKPPKRFRQKEDALEMRVTWEGEGGRRKHRDLAGRWLTPESAPIGKEDRRQTFLWLPPVIWPADQEKMAARIAGALKNGFRNFVLNSPWQQVFFSREKGLVLWAGPFCNIASELAVEQLEALGFSGAIVSPELGKADYGALPGKSPLPLGMVVSGNWPLCVSRTLAEDLNADRLFDSPKGEQAWARRVGADVWVFPNWPLDLTAKTDLLKKAGYQLLVHLSEPLPQNIRLKDRPGLWNWDIGLQ